MIATAKRKRELRKLVECMEKEKLSTEEKRTQKQ